MTYQELKNEYQKKLGELSNECGLFWAFNSEQMKEGIEKNNISKDNKMCSVGMGGYLPFKNYEKFSRGMKELEKWEKAEKKAIKENKKELEKAVLYELSNYECFYTGDYTKVYEIFPEVPASEIKAIYNKNYDSYTNF